MSKEEKILLLKPYTNFEKIKNMTIDELAEKLAIVELNAACEFVSTNAKEYSEVLKTRASQWQKYLESEAEDE